MNTWIWALFVIVFVFLLTYDPKSGTMKSVIGSVGVSSGGTGTRTGSGVSPSGTGASCCADDTFRAQNPKKCEDPHYNGVQFANPAYACPTAPDTAQMGAIIRK
jgi:hypothetical protein